MSTAPSDLAPDLSRELALAIQAARAAGDILKTFYEVPPVVGWKTPDEPVTEADRAANAYLVAQIAGAFPADGILAEESQDDLSRLEKRRVWLVDPLDGTREFIKHNEEFCVMVGVVQDGHPVLGVIYQPMGDRLFAGGAGVPAYMEHLGERYPLRVSQTSGLANLRPVISRSHRSRLVDPITRALGVQRERVIGSLGLKTAALAQGQVDFYFHPSPGPKEWDTCAAEAVLSAAGGVMTDCWDRPLPYNQHDISRRFGVLASNGVCRAELAAAMARALDEIGVDPDFGF